MMTPATTEVYDMYDDLLCCLTRMILYAICYMNDQCRCVNSPWRPFVLPFYVHWTCAGSSSSSLKEGSGVPSASWGTRSEALLTITTPFVWWCTGTKKGLSEGEVLVVSVAELLSSSLSLSWQSSWSYRSEGGREHHDRHACVEVPNCRATGKVPVITEYTYIDREEWELLVIG